MTMLNRLGAWFLRGAPQPVVAGPAPGAGGGVPVDADRPLGCGWFDSSLDLRQGLAVIEHQGIALDLALELMFAPVPTRH